MSKIFTRLLLAVLLGLFAVSSADAVPIFPFPFLSHLTGSQVVPPTGSPAIGSAYMILEGDQLILGLFECAIPVPWQQCNLIGAPTAAEIHCCTPLGTNVDVAVNLPGFPIPSFPYYYTFDLLDSSIYSDSFLTEFGDGTAAGAADALVEGMLGREAYFEVHTSAFPDGEIRGLIYPVPEPATLFLMTWGLGLSRLAVRRRPRGASFR